MDKPSLSAPIHSLTSPSSSKCMIVTAHPSAPVLRLERFKCVTLALRNHEVVRLPTPCNPVGFASDSVFGLPWSH